MAVAVIDRDGTIQFVNKRWTDFSVANGYRGTAFVGVNYFHLCNCVEGAEKEQADSFAGGLRKVLRRNEPVFEMVYPCHAPDKERWFKGVVSVMEEDTVVAHVDITNEYAPFTNQATLLERSKRAHDIQSLLTAIIGYSEMGIGLQRSENSLDAMKGYFKTVEKAGRRLMDEIDEFFIASRKSGDKRKDPTVVVSLSKLLGEICEELAPLAVPSKVEIDLTVDDRYCLWANEEELWRVFTNLLNNAVKYNRTRGLVRVSATVNSSGGIQVTKSDTGIGMAPGEIGIIFEPYKRLDADTAVKLREGKGLGLAIVGELIRKMDATIQVESQVGSGSKFVMEFPAWRTSEHRQSPASAPHAE